MTHERIQKPKRSHKREETQQTAEQTEQVSEFDPERTHNIQETALDFVAKLERVLGVMAVEEASQ